MKVYHELHVIDYYLCCYRVSFMYQDNVYEVANHHDNDGSTNYWWALHMPREEWRLFDIRELWSELGLQIGKVEWRENLHKAIQAGDHHGTEFVVGHLCHIGFKPVLTAEFVPDPDEVRYAEKNAQDMEFTRRYWWESKYELVDPMYVGD